MTFANTANANTILVSTTPPFISKIRFTDASGIEALFQRSECIQLTPGAFHGTASSIEFDAARVLEIVCDRGIYFRADVTSNRLLWAFLKDADLAFERGRMWNAETMLAVTDEELDVSILGPSHIVWIEVRLDRLASEKREVLLNPQSAAAAASDPAAAFPQLRAFGAESDVLAFLSRALSAQHGPIIGTKRQRRSFSLAQRVEHFMWEHVDEPLTLERICANIGCRMRCLIYSFKDTFGLGPMAYLKIRRLNAAHRKLMACEGKSRIFDVAADFGFWHMGHFSTDYKRMFGNTASQTLEAARLAASRQAGELRR